MDQDPHKNQQPNQMGTDMPQVTPAPHGDTSEQQASGTQNTSDPNMAPQQPASSEGTVMLILGYLFPIIFFINTGSQNSFSKFHGNQQLSLLVYSLVIFIGGTFVAMVPIIGLILAMLMPILMLTPLIFAIIGILNVQKHEMKPLPLIGGFFK